MFTVCIFCRATLPANDAIASFPVGRRLAFDAANGRLWVVCTTCARWNLTPLEERWEAIEECERRFRDTALRVSTANIGLARLPEGMELVRIGDPQRPEMAAWRYGDQFGRRRRSKLLALGAGVATVGAIAAGGLIVGGMSATVTWWGLQLLQTTRSVRINRQPVGTALTADGAPTLVRGEHGHDARLVPGLAGEWALHLSASRDSPRDFLLFEGREAIRVASMLLARANRFAGSARDVREATRILDRDASPERCYATAAQMATDDSIRLRHLPPAMRLALEMAAHEATERRALDGELADLERAWREAEEIAAISDDMLLPSNVTQLLARLRGDERNREKRENKKERK